MKSWKPTALKGSKPYDIEFRHTPGEEPLMVFSTYALNSEDALDRARQLAKSHFEILPCISIRPTKPQP